MINKKLFVRAILLVWIFLWILFLVRPYFKKDLLNEYSVLITLSADEKREFVTGRELYDFIKFCNSSVIPSSTYKIIGLDEQPLDHRRALYYLYPNVEREDPEFLFVYKTRGFSKEGYAVFKGMNSEKYILKKIR